MKRLPTLCLMIAVLVGSTGNAFALPECEGSPTDDKFRTTEWSDCIGILSANGNEYFGEWRDGQANGQGTKTYADGRVYVGEWKDARFNGRGIKYHDNGTVDKEGIWKNGMFQNAPKGTPPVIARKSPPSRNADWQKGRTAYKKGDYATALREYTPLAKQGRARSQTSLGVLYRKGHGVPKNDQTATMWYRFAATQGFAPAQYNLGNAYRRGLGAPQNNKTALKWYRLAAKQGFAPAQQNLGWMYRHGRGVPQDYKTAAKWYRLAAKQGHPLAQGNIGLAYKHGRGVSKNLVISLKWLSLSHEGTKSSELYGRKGRYKKHRNKSLRLLNKLKEDMTSSQIAEGQQLARKFVPKKTYPPPQKVIPPVIAKKSPPSESAADNEVENLRKRIAELEKQKQLTPQIDTQKRQELARSSQEELSRGCHTAD